MACAIFDYYQSLKGVADQKTFVDGGIICQLQKMHINMQLKYVCLFNFVQPFLLKLWTILFSMKSDNLNLHLDYRIISGNSLFYI